MPKSLRTLRSHQMNEKQQISALKAQVNALRGLLESALNSSEPDWTFEMTATIDELLTKTPQQCLAEYNKKLINDLFEKHGSYDGFATLAVDEHDANKFLEELKND